MNLKQNKIKLIFIVLNSFIALSHAQIIKGKVVDSLTHQGISFASIVVFGQDYGVSCDSNGLFSIKIPEKYKDSCLHISSVGYKNEIFKINQIVDSITIALQQNIYKLNEVKIKAKKSKDITLKRIRKSTWFQMETMSNFAAPKAIGKVFYYNKKYKNYYIKNIKIAFNRYEDFKYKPSFFIRIMNIDSSTNLPDKDITKELLIQLDTCQQEGHFVYSKNIEHLNITIPPEGIFVGVQWILAENNKIALSYEGKDYIYLLPYLKMKWRIGRKNMNIITNKGGIWEKGGGINGKANAEPYIEVTLTN